MLILTRIFAYQTIEMIVNLVTNHFCWFLQICFLRTEFEKIYTDIQFTELILISHALYTKNQSSFSQHLSNSGSLHIKSVSYEIIAK